MTQIHPGDDYRVPEARVDIAGVRRDGECDGGQEPAEPSHADVGTWMDSKAVARITGGSLACCNGTARDDRLTDLKIVLGSDESCYPRSLIRHLPAFLAGDCIEDAYESWP
jgi:hypothetical protein